MLCEESSCVSKISIYVLVKKHSSIWKEYPCVARKTFTYISVRSSYKYAIFVGITLVRPMGRELTKVRYFFLWNLELQELITDAERG